MKAFSLLFLFFSAFAHAGQGDLVKVTHLGDTPAQVIAQARQQLCPDEAAVTKAFGFATYKIDFKTVDLIGNAVVSSGLIHVPATTGAMPVFVYQHGTVFARSELPSSGTEVEVQGAGVCLASLGYVSILADYLGYGDGTGYHPYLHSASESWVARDMMRATMKALKTLNVQTNKKLFIAGYSQGGHAAMSLVKFLEHDPKHEFKITAAAPMAGPYALSATIGVLAASPNPHSTAEAASLVVGLNQVYQFYADPSQLFTDDYADMIEPEFDGSHPSTEVFNTLNVPLAKVFNDHFLKEDVGNPKSLFIKQIAKNDVYKWTPKTPLHLYHAASDTEVPFANSQAAFNYMTSKKANVTLINLGNKLTHQQGYPLAMGQAALWFETF